MRSEDSVRRVGIRLGVWIQCGFSEGGAQLISKDLVRMPSLYQDWRGGLHCIRIEGNVFIISGL